MRMFSTWEGRQGACCEGAKEGRRDGGIEGGGDLEVAVYDGRLAVVEAGDGLDDVAENAQDLFPRLQPLPRHQPVVHQLQHAVCTSASHLLPSSYFRPRSTGRFWKDKRVTQPLTVK